MLLPDQSRSTVQRLIKDGHVSGAVTSLRPSTLVRAGQQYDVEIPAPSAATPQAEALPLRIVFEDPDLVVLDKPAGMVVHPAAGHSGGTLVNALLHHVTDLSGIGGGMRPRNVPPPHPRTARPLGGGKKERAPSGRGRAVHEPGMEKGKQGPPWGGAHPGGP